MVRKGLLFLAALLVASSVGFLSSNVDAKTDKKWTITERSEALKKEVDAGQKAGELTAKESESLKEQAGKIDAKIVKMKSKNDGKLSYDNENSLEKDLNKLSLRIQKLKLEKRVQK
jgi:hypothetical protein